MAYFVAYFLASVYMHYPGWPAYRAFVALVHLGYIQIKFSDQDCGSEFKVIGRKILLNWSVQLQVELV